MNLDPVNGVQNISRYQGPATTFKLNHLTGVVEQIPAVTGGIDFLTDHNSKPTPAPLINTGRSNFGTPASPIHPPLVPVRVSGNAVDGLTLDPNVRMRVNGDTRDARQKGAALFG